MKISRLHFLQTLAAGMLFPAVAQGARKKPSGNASGIREEKRVCPLGREYWLYQHPDADPSRIRQLVVGVHPNKGQGKGAMGIADWAVKFPDVIVVGPTFPSTGPYYQLLQGETAKQLNGIHDLLSKEFKLHPRFFIHGYSGGAQFAHRYAALHPDRLVAVSAHSAGTWDRIKNPRAKKVLWTVSCGTEDTAESMPGSGSRIANFRTFAKALHSDGYAAHAFVRPGGHGRSPSVNLAAEATFLTATSGIFPWQQATLAGLAAERREAWIAANTGLKEDIFDDGATKYPLKRNPDGWTLNDQALALLKAARTR